MICDEWRWVDGASPGAVPRYLRDLEQKIERFVLPPRRPQRSYPRAVKLKMSNYPKKRTSSQSDGPARDRAQDHPTAK